MFKRGKKLKKFSTPVKGDNNKFWTKAMFLHYIYNILIVLVGVGFMIWGGRMIINGIAGKIDWIIEIFGNKSKILNATPGVFFILVGFLIIIFARSDTEYKSK